MVASTSGCCDDADTDKMWWPFFKKAGENAAKKASDTVAKVARENSNTIREAVKNSPPGSPTGGGAAEEDGTVASPPRTDTLPSSPRTDTLPSSPRTDKEYPSSRLKNWVVRDVGGKINFVYLSEATAVAAAVGGAAVWWYRRDR
ncbi:hypothetical protein ZWY2020_001237 [Hordeum vulgare]|nr:hypothetical protein ZWY2020_001237 [Hordeum vulgare]